MVMNGCDVVVVGFGLTVGSVTSTTCSLTGSFRTFVTGLGLIVDTVAFLLINGRTDESVTRLVGFVRIVAVVGRFDAYEDGDAVVVGLRVVVTGFDVVVVTRTPFFVVDELSFPGSLLPITLAAVGLCRLVGLLVVVVGLLLGVLVFVVVGALVVVVVTVSCTD